MSDGLLLLALYGNIIMARCKICRQSFQKRSISHLVCSYECSLQLVTLERQKREKKELRIAKEKLKTRRDYLKEAQIAFNAYIRARDSNRPCICCGIPLVANAIGGGFDCGHYRSVGSAPHLRFDEHNAHAQRKQCNRWGSGRAVDYRLGLIHRIGMEAVEALESDQTTKHYSIDDLKAIKAEYKLKLKQLIQQRKEN